MTWSSIESPSFSSSTSSCPSWGHWFHEKLTALPGVARLVHLVSRPTYSEQQESNVSPSIRHMVEQLNKLTYGTLEPLSNARPPEDPSWDFLEKTWKRLSPKEALQVNATPRIVPFGDIHGMLEGFKENLVNSGLVNKEDEWIGGQSIGIQLGDVIDRGPDSEAAWDYLAAIQAKAAKRGGSFVRLFGNHELMLCEGNYSFARAAILSPHLFARRVKKDILEGKVQFAYFDGTRLYTHAGVRSALQQWLMKEIADKKHKEMSQVSGIEIADHMNELLIEAVKRENYTHPVFQVGQRRGGAGSRGGALWEDLSDMMQSRCASDLPQVIAHTPPRHPSDSPIRLTQSARLLDVDAGLHPCYGGNNAYAMLSRSTIFVRRKRNDYWEEARIPDPLKSPEGKSAAL